MVHFCPTTLHTRRWLNVQSNSEELQYRHRHAGVSRRWSALGAVQRCRVVIACSKQTIRASRRAWSCWSDQIALRRFEKPSMVASWANQRAHASSRPKWYSKVLSRASIWRRGSLGRCRIMRLPGFAAHGLRNST